MEKNKLTLRGKHLEFLPALFEILWGLWILNPLANTFSFGLTNAYSLILNVAPEWAWGLGILALGIFQMVVVFTPKLYLRIISSILCLFTFIVIGFLISAGNFMSITIPSYLVLALCEWFAYTELLGDIKEEKTWK